MPFRNPAGSRTSAGPRAPGPRRSSGVARRHRDPWAAPRLSRIQGPHRGAGQGQLFRRCRRTGRQCERKQEVRQSAAKGCWQDRKRGPRRTGSCRFIGCAGMIGRRTRSVQPQPSGARGPVGRWRVRVHGRRSRLRARSFLARLGLTYAIGQVRRGRAAVGPGAGGSIDPFAGAGSPMASGPRASSTADLIDQDGRQEADRDQQAAEQHASLHTSHLLRADLMTASSA